MASHKGVAPEGIDQPRTSPGRHAADTGRARHAADAELVPLNTLMDPLNAANTGPLRIPAMYKARNPLLGVACATAAAIVTTTTGAINILPTASEAREAAPATGSQEVVAEEKVKIAPPQVTVKAAPEKKLDLAPAAATVWYTVRPGDTLGKIAARYRTSWQSIQRLNGLRNPNIIYVGQRLRVTGTAPAPVVRVASTSRQATIARSALAQVGWRQDCVAMTARALRSVGINYYVWPWQYYNIGRAIPMSQAVPGDLLYYRNGGGGLAHIAVYIGGGKAVHGGWNGNQTVIFSAYVGSGPNAIRV